MIKNLKPILSAALIAAAMTASASTELVIRGTKFKVDTIEHYKAGPGMTYTSLVYNTTSGTARKFKAYVVTADTQVEGGMKLRMELGRDSLAKTEAVSAIAKRKSNNSRQYLAGINADFFVTSSFANAMGRPHMVGWPNMACVVDGMTVCQNGPFDGANRYGHFIVGETSADVWCDVPTITFRVKTPAGGYVTIQPVNWDRSDNTVILYNSGVGNYTHTTKGGKEIQAVLVDGETWGVNKTMHFKVVGNPSTAGNMAIPKDGIVLSAGKDVVSQLDGYTPGSEFTVQTILRMAGNMGKTYKISAVSGGDVVLLKDGEAVLEADRWINPRDTRYPRTMAGYSEDRSKVVFCVVDGKNVGGSTGVTYPEGAEMMRSYGCYDAVNFDGGGSSEMYLQMPGIVNTPSDGAERAVGNALYMTIDAPLDNVIAEIRFKDWAKTLDQNDEYTPVFYGYNQYGRLIDTKVTGVRLDCPDALGSVTTNGATLMATGAGTHALTATKGNMKATIAVTVAGDAGVESVLAGSNSDMPVEWYNLCGVRINPETAQHGMYLRRQGAVTEKVVL